jgi:cytochrome c oxidase assembly protein Cox11
MDWEFEPANEEMIINAGETALTFYKAYNKENFPIIGTNFYLIFFHVFLF